MTHDVDPSGEPDATADVRARHAAARLEGALAAGLVSEAEAAALVEQVRSGGHSPELRTRINHLARAARRA